MKTLLLIVVALWVPEFSVAQENPNGVNPADEKRLLICDQLSDPQCFARPVDSICMVDAQKGQAGFCRQRSNVYAQEYVTCWCY